MIKHVDILLLLDYAQGKVADEVQYEMITDHLCDCEHCQRILKSHYYLIANQNTLLEELFPDPILARQAIEEPSLDIIQSISNKVKVIKKRGGILSQDIKLEISRILEDIRSLPKLEQALIPVKVENISLLGAEDSKGPKEQGMRFLSGNIRLHFLPAKGLKIEDFEYQFTGKFFYVVCKKENYAELKDRTVNLTTDIGSPFIFNTCFNEAHGSVIARFEVKFDEILKAEMSESDKEDYHDFFLGIE